MENAPTGSTPCPEEGASPEDVYADDEFATTQPETEPFTDMPNRREALRAKDPNNLTIFLTSAVAKKLYRCQCCEGNIAIGSEHVIMGRVQMSKRFTHHHLDFSCTQERILPTLSQITIINPSEASVSEVNRKRRRYRNKKRRSN